MDVHELLTVLAGAPCASTLTSLSIFAPRCTCEACEHILSRSRFSRSSTYPPGPDQEHRRRNKQRQRCSSLRDRTRNTPEELRRIMAHNTVLATAIHMRGSNDRSPASRRSAWIQKNGQLQLGSSAYPSTNILFSALHLGRENPIGTRGSDLGRTRSSQQERFTVTTLAESRGSIHPDFMGIYTTNIGLLPLLNAPPNDNTVPDPIHNTRKRDSAPGSSIDRARQVNRARTGYNDTAYHQHAIADEHDLIMLRP
jgi:hypothetical protein